MSQEIPLLRTGKTFLWNYYDKSGREIDAILKEKGGYSGIEIKYRTQVMEIDMKKIEYLKNILLLAKKM